MADLPAATIVTRDFSLVSPLTSLTVRRLRKEPPVLLKNAGGDGGNGFSEKATTTEDAANKGSDLVVESKYSTSSSDRVCRRDKSPCESLFSSFQL